MGSLKIANRLGDTRTNQFANINKTDAPQRTFKLGNNHITTANFGDLIPAYWAEARPRDKFELDCNIVAKFLALIAPAYCKADITVDWFFVPTKMISPRSLEFLQNGPFTGNDTQTNNVFDVNSTLYGETYFTKKDLDNGAFGIYGIPRVHTLDITRYLQSNNGYYYNGMMYGFKYFLKNSVKHSWRDSGSSLDTTGFENLPVFGNKYRVSRLLDYMGIPKSISTYKYTDDIYCANVTNIPRDSSLKVVLPCDIYADRLEHFSDYINPNYLALLGNDYYLATSICSESTSTQYTIVSSNTEGTSLRNDNVTKDSYYEKMFDYPHFNAYKSVLTSVSDYLIDVRPFQAYQKIYNDYYRDPVKQDPIRIYTDFVGFSKDFSESTAETQNNGNTPAFSDQSATRLFNNLFMLRRRNYDKDWLNNSLLSDQLTSQTNVNYQPFNSRFLNNMYKYSIKKAVTSQNKYFDWLANFMDSHGNDYLTNMVTYIGGNRFPITISETLQTSSTDSESPQGNRSGNMNAYQNTNKHYFSAPDFGYIMCIVSLLPKISYFNGLPQRFRNLTMLSQDLPDFNNIGFQPVMSSELRAVRNGGANSTFGYLPFGYQHKMIQDMVTGDFSKSLSYWHQSPDLDSPYLVDYKTYNGSDPNISTRLFNYKTCDACDNYPNSADFPAVGLKQINNNLMSSNEYYNNIFAVTTDASGDHCQLTMDFYVNCSRAMSENEILVDDSLI